MYKTPPTIAKEGTNDSASDCTHVSCVCVGLSTVSVSLPYGSVVTVWEQAGTTEDERRTGETEYHHI